MHHPIINLNGVAILIKAKAQGRTKTTNCIVYINTFDFRILIFDLVDQTDPERPIDLSIKFIIEYLAQTLSLKDKIITSNSI